MTERVHAHSLDSFYKPESARTHLYAGIASYIAKRRDPLERRALLDWFTLVQADSIRATIAAEHQETRSAGIKIEKSSFAAQARAEERFLIAQRRLHKSKATRKALGGFDTDKYLRTTTYLSKFYGAACDAEAAVMRSHGMHNNFSDVEIDASIKENIVEKVSAVAKELKMKRREKVFPKRKVIFYR